MVGARALARAQACPITPSPVSSPKARDRASVGARLHLCMCKVPASGADSGRMHAHRPGVEASNIRGCCSQLRAEANETRCLPASARLSLPASIIIPSLRPCTARPLVAHHARRRQQPHNVPLSASRGNVSPCLGALRFRQHQRNSWAASCPVYKSASTHLLIRSMPIFEGAPPARCLFSALNPPCGDAIERG